MLLIRGRSLFPGSLLRLSVARQRSIALVDERLAGGAHDHHAAASLGPRSTTLAIMTEEHEERGESQHDPELGKGVNGVVSSREMVGGRRPLRIHRFGCGARVLRVDRGTPAQGFAYVGIVQATARVLTSAAS